MPRKRNKENQGLPKRWQSKHGAYYYQVPPGLEHLWDNKKLFRLGGSLAEAYKAWAARLEVPVKVKTIGDLLDRYGLEVVPTKAITTQPLNQLWIKQLHAVFGEMPLEPFPPSHVYTYVDMRSRKQKNESGRLTGGEIAAHREIEVLSHAFTKAVEWGYINRHPFLGQVRLKGETPRNRYVEDWEVLECLSLTSKRQKGSVKVIQAYIKLKLMTGMAKSDLLRLEPGRHFKDDGIHNQRHKTIKSTGKRTVYLWTPELIDVKNQAIALRPVHISPFLFCNKKGEGYINEATGSSNGWDSMWQRFMDRVLKETKVTVRFTEHDLRAKCASDATTLEHARALLAHADSRTTDEIYRRKPEIVMPAKGV